MPEHRDPAKPTESANLSVLPPGPLFSVTAAQEIPKPKNWQDFQRGCVVLFQAELRDPHAQEYGRHGQKQCGIDVLGRRNGDPNHFVGIQCRRYVEPLKKANILKDCRDALAIRAGLKEIIFATTCPSDIKATDAANDVERELRAEGHDLRVVIHSWSDLELKICQHPTALAFFFPSAVASTAAQSVRLDPDSPIPPTPLVAPTAASFVAREPLDGPGKFRASSEILGSVSNFPEPDSVVMRLRQVGRALSSREIAGVSVGNNKRV